jgi:thiamine biosynthesis lipoprotein
LLKSNLNNEMTGARVRWTMGTLCSLEAPGAPLEAATAAFEEIERWDRILSAHRDDSELAKVNLAAGLGALRVSADFFVAAASALRFAELSEGLFDPTLRPSGWREVSLDARARTIELPSRGMELDFGGFGKGWALDRAAQVLKRSWAGAALFNFGGQILAVGAPEGAAGWLVEVPGANEPLLLRDASVAVSSDSERPGHIRSPFDGSPVRKPLSAAAVCATAAEADAWSTPLYLLGRNPSFFRGRSFFQTSDTGGRS